MHKAYIYPISNRLKSGIYNPYIDNFINFSSENYIFLNKTYPSNTGLFNIIKYINKIDIIFFNWIEKLPEFKGGFLQTLFLYFLLAYSKIKKVKIVWTMHNRIAHSNKHFFLKNLIFNMMIKKSDLIITHSTDGIALINRYNPGFRHIFYFPHPVIGNLPFDNDHKEYDILIWGSLVPYKGIDSFLDFLFKKNLQDKYKIKIIGKCSDIQYLKKLNSFTNDHIKIENRFIDNRELQQIMSLTRIVLFTYSGESILSSGALAESISHRAIVVGPYKAAFRDMADLNYIFPYVNFDLMVDLIDKILSGKRTIPKERFDQFLKEFHWSEFAKKLDNELYQLN